MGLTCKDRKGSDSYSVCVNSSKAYSNINMIIVFLSSKLTVTELKLILVLRHRHDNMKHNDGPELRVPSGAGDGAHEVNESSKRKSNAETQSER